MLANLTGTVLPGADAFRLYDTYGFPVDLTKDILSEKGLTVDEEEFDRLMKEQRERARAARKDAGADAWKAEAGAAEQLPATRFTGYESLEGAAKVLAILKAGAPADSLAEGEEGVLVLDETPFYAESGGQAGTRARWKTATGCSLWARPARRPGACSCTAA